MPLLVHADHIDTKTVTGTATLREFVAAMLNYQPGWLTALFGVRGVLVCFLGMRQQRVPQARQLRPETLPMQPGSRASLFTVRMAEEDHYWIAEASDSHLTATLGVVMKPLDDNSNQFYVITIVHYRNWAGPVYFNIIRPFHHLVIRQMAKAGVQ